MDQVTNILVIVDPLTRGQAAVAKAAILARCLGSAIELLICNTKSSREVHLEGSLPPESNAFLNDNLDLLLEEIAEPLRDDGLDVATHIIDGDPLHSTVISWMRNCPADLVVKDTHHHSFAQRAFTTNTDWHFIRDCSVPLLLTKPKIWAQRPVIVAALAPGHLQNPAAGLDQSILDAATFMATRFETQVHALQAYPGTAVECLPRMAADCLADIVVMGTQPGGDLKCSLMGGTTERVLESMPCDILVVKPPDFSRNLPF